MNIGFIERNKHDKPKYILADGAEIYSDISSRHGYHQYFSDDPVYLVLKDYGDYYMVRHHSLSDGITGFFKKSDVVKVDYAN